MGVLLLVYLHDSIPLTGETVKVYVSRMFSQLNIGEGSFDDLGRFTVEFPSDLPGEADGSVQIFARIEDNDKYANIETSQSYPWGVPSMHGPTGSHRALWTANSPDVDDNYPNNSSVGCLGTLYLCNSSINFD